MTASRHERGGQLGKHGRPRRKPHYITIQFTGGKVAGRPVVVKLKDRVRGTGAIGNQATKVTLHQALVETGSSEVENLLGRLPNKKACMSKPTPSSPTPPISSNK